ncbi:MAG: thioredoxin domain-containing protein [Acidobacteriota bacterium]|nr:thioredoxin domain-containing protein [Acidobacteriota bacterium]
MRSLLLAASVLLTAVSLSAQPPLAANGTPAAQAPAVALPPGAPSVELTDNFFKRILGYDPNIQVHIISITASRSPELFDVFTAIVTPEGQQLVHWYVTHDLKFVVAGELRVFGTDPYRQERELLAKKSFGPTRGPASAKVTVVEFADLECPACRDAQPVMDRLYADFPNVRFIFQSYPLAQMHPWAFRAASYLDCIARGSNDQAFNFIGSIYSHQREIESIIRRTGDDGKPYIDDNEVAGRLRHYTDNAGADMTRTTACAAGTDTEVRVQRSIGLAQELNITSTPTLYVNGRSVGNPSSLPYETLKAIISFEVDQAGAEK